MKPLKFVGSALEDLQSFAITARRAAGFELWAVQRGLLPSDWKAMPTVGAGAYGICIHVPGEWRVIYVAKFTKSIYVLHAFQKKSQKTRAADVALAARRFNLHLHRQDAIAIESSESRRRSVFKGAQP